MKKILFLHGFYASGQCIPAMAMRDAFEGKALVLTPDLPTHPRKALELIRDICDKEKPDLLVGNSCGSFYAQMLAPVVGIPALLGNPHFQMTEFLKTRIGIHQHKSPRKDGRHQFIIDETLIQEFAELEAVQFDYCNGWSSESHRACLKGRVVTEEDEDNPYFKDRIWGLFGQQDTLAHFEPIFLEHYNRTFHFPGGHTPTADEVRSWYVPLAEKMLVDYPLPEDGIRYFLHFKGGRYRYVQTAFDSETKERMVVYQALYGDKQYWVRPEKMFFENIECDGRKFARFTEIDPIKES